jgi:hypothetical protein
MYKTLYIKYNPSFEYQRQNGVWFKRPIATKEMWQKLDARGSDVLKKAFKGKNEAFFYSNYFIVGSVAVISLLAYFGYTKFLKK